MTRLCPILASSHVCICAQLKAATEKVKPESYDSPASQRPLRGVGVKGKPSPTSGQLMPPPPALKRPSSRAESDAGSETSRASSSVSRGKRHDRPEEGGNAASRPRAALPVADNFLAALLKPANGTAPPTTPSPPPASVRRCIWCFCRLGQQNAEHVETTCIQRTFPSIADWRRLVAKTPSLQVPAATRSSSSSSAAAPPVQKPGGRKQTDRSHEQQDAYTSAYKRWHRGEVYRLEREAHAQLADYQAALDQPLVSSSPSGEFSDYEMLKLEFAKLLPSKVSPALLEPGVSWEKVNSSAEQHFSREVRACDAFDSLASARMPGERADNDFALLHARCEAGGRFALEVDAKLAHWRSQLLQRHAGLARVKALPPDSPLMAIFVAITTSRGRPPSAAGSDSSSISAHEKKETYAGGMFTPACMVDVTNYESSSAGSSVRDTKAKILGGAGILFTGVPDADAAAGRKQRGKTVHVPARSTQHGHRRDVALWRIQKAAEAMGPIRAIFFDEGTRSDGQAGLVLGASGLMRDGTVNRRFCGVEFPLPNKLGSTIADAVLAICRRNLIERCYQPLSDSVSSTIGHRTGAIAFLRQVSSVSAQRSPPLGTSLPPFRHACGSGSPALGAAATLPHAQPHA